MWGKAESVDDVLSPTPVLMDFTLKKKSFLLQSVAVQAWVAADLEELKEKCKKEQASNVTFCRESFALVLSIGK